MFENDRNSGTSDPAERDRRRARLHLPSLAAIAVVAFLMTGCEGSSQPPADSPAQSQSGSTAAPIGPAQTADGVQVTIDTLRTTDESGMTDLDPETEAVDTEELPEGYEFLVLAVTITNVETTAHEYNAFSWYATDPATDTRYPPAFMAMTDNNLYSGDLEPAEAVSGDVVIAIPVGTTALRVAYDTQLANQGETVSWDITIPSA